MGSKGVKYPMGSFSRISPLPDELLRKARESATLVSELADALEQVTAENERLRIERDDLDERVQTLEGRFG